MMGKQNTGLREIYHNKYLANNLMKHLSLKLIIAIIILSFFAYYDFHIGHGINSALTRTLPIGIAIILLFFNLVSKNYASLKVKIYNFFLVSMQLMMLANCLVHINDKELPTVVSGTILIIFIISLEIKSKLLNTILIYTLPITAFIVSTILFFDVPKEQYAILANVYPILLVGFIVNRIQNNLSFNIFKANQLLSTEKERTKDLYEESQIQNEILNTKNEEIEAQQKVLEHNHKNLTSSVNYARSIQSAMLPTHEIFNTYFTEHLIFYQPKEIVSGDFYWAKEKNGLLIFAVADCTGHGVPGAFVSMLGISMLNEIVNKLENPTAGEILCALRSSVKQLLRQSATGTTSKDGMDIALCIYNPKTSELQYSGAYNPLYILRSGVFTDLPADRQPIGIYRQETAFTNHIFKLQKNDILYLFSDGYIDQFNGSTGEKFKVKRFKELLIGISHKTLDTQQKIINETFINWKGQQKQIDDILILGLKI